ncbi:MAG: sialidase family protein [Thermomicrobiales bacterium]
MIEPTPHFEADSPIEVVEAATLFPADAITHRTCGSLARVENGRLLLAYRTGAGPVRQNDGEVMVTSSVDDGRSWVEPVPIYSYPEWDCLPMGGLVRFADDRIRAIVGRVRVDASLGGDEPFGDWYITSRDSRDGGRTWEEPGPEIRLFPYWTEMYGASNPHPLADGRFLLAVMGTTGRDSGWQAGITTSTGRDHHLTPPVIIAAAPDRNFSDTDVVRLSDGRFLAVSREHFTRQSFCAHSGDEGRTWSAIQPTGFQGANIKLVRLRSGAVLCAYRDESPGATGVCCSVSEDGGITWRLVGRLYTAAPGNADALARTGILCGYPDLVSINDRDIACVVHTYPDAAGRVGLHVLRLRDVS